MFRSATGRGKSYSGIYSGSSYSGSDSYSGSTWTVDDDMDMIRKMNARMNTPGYDPESFGGPDPESFGPPLDM